VVIFLFRELEMANTIGLSGKGKKQPLPKPLSEIKSSAHFILHNVLSPEMNTIEAVLSSDDVAVFIKTTVSKELEGFGKLFSVFDIKTGSISQKPADVLVHELDVEILYSMPKK